MQGLFHTQVLQLLLSGGEAVTLRATALETTSIKTGGRRRDPNAIKMARRSVASTAKPRSKSRRDDKRRKTSLFRKLSSKKATAEMQMLTGSQSLNSLSPANPGLLTFLIKSCFHWKALHLRINTFWDIFNDLPW